MVRLPQAALPSLFSYDFEVERDLNFRMRPVRDLELTEGLDRFVQFDLAAVDLDVMLLLEQGSDVAVADRTVDAAVTGTHWDRQFGFTQQFLQALGIGLQLGELTGAKLKHRIQAGLVGAGGRHGQSLRHQVVAGVSRPDLDQFTRVTELVDAFQQDDVHLRTSFSVIGMMASIRARLMVTASLR